MQVPSFELDRDEVVRLLALVPHPEGGFYRETYRAAELLPQAALPRGFGGARAVSTAIYFLVPQGSFSALHRIASDEVWHHYAGAPLEVIAIFPDGRREDVRLGCALKEGERPQAVVPAGAWFGSRLALGSTGDWSLVGCTVAPSFEFADFEMGNRAELLRHFPQHEAIVRELTRG